MVKFDLYLRNTSEYLPNSRPISIVRNGKAGQNGDFGVINLADDQSCGFEFIFVNAQTGRRHAVSQAFEFFFFDFDSGKEGRLIESLDVCGIIGYETSEQRWPGRGISSTVDVTEHEQGCFTFTATEPFSGDNNPKFAREIFVDFDMLDQTTLDDVLPYLVALK